VLQVTGDQRDVDGNFTTEELEVWHRDPVECIQELLEAPAFGKENAYTPYRVYRDKMRKNREYGEMATADWWWETQVR